MEVIYSGDKNSNIILVQPVMETGSVPAIPGRDFLHIALKVDDWNAELSPWKADPVYKNKGFDGKAEETFRFMMDIVQPFLGGERHLYLGGYSLAGLYALWAAGKTEVFTGVAAVSPSVWFPGFREYLAETGVKTGHVYLSLGKKESHNRNPLLAGVADAILEVKNELTKQGVTCTFEWNEGNHFTDPDIRMNKGFTALIN